MHTWYLQAVKTSLAHVFSLLATCLIVLDDILFSQAFRNFLNISKMFIFHGPLRNVKELYLLKLKYFRYSDLSGFSTQVLFLLRNVTGSELIVKW